MVNHENHHGADHRNHHAVQIQPGYAGPAERGKQPAANEGSDDAEQDVEHYSFASPIDQLAADEARDETQDDPGKK